MRLILAALAALSLGACSSNGGDGDGGGSGAIDPASLCVSSSCGEKIALLTVPDAENILFAPDGRLFVSGGTNVFEIRREGQGYAATPLSDTGCNYTGLAIRGDVLYANCYSGAQLHAARLTAQPQLQAIHDYGIPAANGLVDGPDNDLYTTNGPIPTGALPDPQVRRLRLDPADPFKVIEDVEWTREGLLGPNGVQRRGRTLYVSNTGQGGLGEIRAYDIGADGSAGPGRQFADLGAIPDDFSFAGDFILAAAYVNGQITLVGPDGTIRQQTDPMSFDSPSQVRLARPPLFAADDILVTEKGIIGDNDSPVGNRLSVFRRKPQTP